MANPTLDATIGPSGATVLVRFLDGDGDPTDLVDYNVASVETVEVNGGGGPFTWSFGGHTTTTLPIASLASDVEAAFCALASVGVGNATVTGRFPYVVTFTGALTGLAEALITVNTGSLTATGTAPALTAGTTAQSIVGSTPSATYLQTGHWVVGIAPFGAAAVVAAAGLGLNTAEWLTTGLAAGHYGVFLSNSLASGSTVSPSTSVRAFDGITQRFHVAWDQSSDVSNVSLPGSSSTYRRIGTAKVSASSTLRVLITDEVAPADVGKLVITNELALVPVDPAAAVFYDALNSSYVTLTGGWSNFADGWSTRERFSADPSQMAQWEFAGLLPNSSYKFEAQWNPGPNRPTAVVYTVYDSDGTTSLGTVTVNQTAASSGGSNLTDANARAWAFSVIGTFTVTGTTAFIRLHPTSDGTNVTMAEACACTLVTAGGYKETVGHAVASFSQGFPSISVNGGADIALDKAIWKASGGPLEKYPIIDFPLATPVLASDSVTFSSGANGFTTAAGVVASITAQAVTNLTGGSLGPATPASDRLAIGENLMGLGGSAILYMNAAKNATGIRYGAGTAQPPNADLYPQSLSQTIWFMDFVSSVNPIDTKGYPLWPAGITTIMWNEPAGFTPQAVPSAGTTPAYVASRTGQATDNYVQVDLANDGTSYGPDWSLGLVSLYVLRDDADLGSNTKTGTWTAVSNAAAFNGGYHHNDSLAASVWTQTIGALQAGTYAISNTWIANAANTPTCTVTVKEAGSTIASYTVDQTVAPNTNAARDYGYNAVNFSASTPFTCTGGTITVEIHGTNGALCIVDGLQITLSGNLASGTPLCPFSNLRVYPPISGVDPLSSPPRFNPDVLALLKGSRSLRSMQILNSNSGAMREFADYPPATQLFYGQGGRVEDYTVTSVATSTNPGGYFGANTGWALITVTALDGAPLPILTGTPVILQGALNVPFDTTGTLVLDGNFGVVYHDPATMPSGQFAIGTSSWTGPTAAAPNSNVPAVTSLVTSPYTSFSNVTAHVGYQGIPPADYFELVATVSTLNTDAGLEPCDVYLNLTPLVTQACVEAMADAYMAALPVGSRVYLELANEPWNDSSGFPFSGYWFGQAVVQGLADPQTAYAKAAAQIHAWFAARLGARAGELVRVFNVQFGAQGTMDSVTTYCNAHGLPIDMVVTAPYISAQPANETAGGMADIYPDLTAPQLIDFTWWWFLEGGFYAENLALYQARCAAQGCLLGCYEGGLASLSMGGDATTQDAQAINGRYHPDVYPMMFGWHSFLQGYGVKTANNYNFDQLPVNDGGGATNSTYGVYWGTAVKRGRGDGSDALHDNRTEVFGGPPGLVDMATAVSPLGLAFNDWNGPGAGGVTLPIYDRVAGNGAVGVNPTTSSYTDPLLAGGTHYTAGTLRGGTAAVTNTTPRRIGATSSSGACLVAPASIAPADCRIEMLVYYADATIEQVFVAGRTDDAGWTSGYQVLHYNGQLFLTVEPSTGANVPGSGSPVSFPISAGDTHHYTLEMSGPDISAYGDGVSLMSATDTRTTAAGFAGFGFFAGSPSDTVGPQVAHYAVLNTGTTPTIGTPTASGPVSGAATFQWLPIDGGMGPGEYQLQRSPDGSTWTNVGSATFDWTASDSGQTGTKFYRIRATQPGAVVTDSGSVTVAYGVPAATAYTLTAPSPSQGQPGIASGTFAVQLDGIPSGAVTITPAAASGTFFPASLTINDAAPHTFTFTAAVVGAITISTTNNGGLTDPASVTYTAFALTILPAAQTTALATATFLTATLTGGTGVLAASATGGTLSTTAPTSGTPFTLTTPSSGAGTITVTVTGPGGTSDTGTVSYPTGKPIRKDHGNWMRSLYRRAFYGKRKGSLGPKLSGDKMPRGRTGKPR